MISEAIDTIKILAEAGQEFPAPTVVPVDKNDSRHAYLWNQKTGTMDKIELQRPDRKHSITTLDSLAGAFARYGEKQIPSVWVSLTAVVVVLDDPETGFRADRITFPIQPSPLFDVLTKLPVQQKPLLNAVRHDLKPSRITPDSFELAIANLRWETTDVAEGNLGTVKSTMGRQVNAEVKGTSDIPPEVSVEFEPFPSLADKLQTSVVVECSAVIDPAERTLSVRPYPGQIDLAKATAVERLRAKIAEMLDADDKVVFAGSP